MAEKGLRHITVQNISDKADIHRVTFYKHFPEIYDVYEQLTKKFLSDVGIMLMERGEKTAAVFYHNMLNYVSEHSVYFKMIFSSHSTSGLYLDLLEIECLVFSEQLGSGYPESVLTCDIRYHVNGCFAVIADWVMTGFEQSQDYIVNMLSVLDKSIRTYLKSQHT